VSEELHEDVKCGTFEDWSFGGILRRYRRKRNLTMRQASIVLGFDCGNYSKVENNRLPPPKSFLKLKKQLKPLNLNEHELRFLAVAAFNHHIGQIKSKWSF
jgi:transcriptional regulator with XRE-family HTH domain